jgi:HK97 family phage prohead protease
MIEGYALLWDDINYGESPPEQFRPYAFDMQLSGGYGNHIRLRREHYSDVDLASVRDGTLRVAEDNFGLKFWASLTGANYAIVASEIRHGCCPGVSINFKNWQARNENGRQLIVSAQLIEISLVSEGAYPQGRTWLTSTDPYSLDPDRRQQRHWFHMNNDSWRARYVKAERQAALAPVAKPAARSAPVAVRASAVMPAWPIDGQFICHRNFTQWARRTGMFGRAGLR